VKVLTFCFWSKIRKVNIHYLKKVVILLSWKIKPQGMVVPQWHGVHTRYV
jgi:hypothetical protein